MKTIIFKLLKAKMNSEGILNQCLNATQHKTRHKKPAWLYACLGQLKDTQSCFGEDCLVQCVQ